MSIAFVSSRRRRVRASGVAVLAVAVLALAACGGDTESDDPPAEEEQVDEEQAVEDEPSVEDAEVEEDDLPDEAADEGGSGDTDSVEVEPITASLTVTDAAGEQITLDSVPERIVCVTGACDDMLFSLGINPVATSTPALLALPEYLGEDADEIASIPGAFGQEDIEAIAAQEPDIVIGLTGVHEGLAEPLAEFAPLWTLAITDYEDSVTNLRALAALVDEPEAGVEVETRFRQTLAEARDTAASEGLDEVAGLTMYSSGFGRGVNTDDDLLGGLTAEIFDYPWPSKGGGFETAQAYSIEEILEQDPDIIFVQSFTAGDGATMSEELADDPVWNRITAVQEGRVYEVLPTLWSSGRGPNALTLVLEEMIDAATS